MEVLPSNGWTVQRANSNNILKKVYFRSKILVHKYWATLEYTCVAVLLAIGKILSCSRIHKHPRIGRCWSTIKCSRIFQCLGLKVHFFSKYFCIMHRMFYHHSIYSNKSPNNWNLVSTISRSRFSIKKILLPHQNYLIIGQKKKKTTNIFLPNMIKVKVTLL